jgi:hypothetical protein
MHNPSENITLSRAQVDRIAAEVARTHVLKVLEEIEQWLASGRKIENYLLIKRNLYTKSTS